MYKHRWQAPPPNSDLEARLESISDQVHVIEVALTREFSAHFGFKDREHKLDTLLNEPKSKLDDLSNSGRSRSQPCVHLGNWKSEAFTIIGTSRQGQKSTTIFSCFDDNCHWRDKCVTLNAYINHLKREPHIINISTNPELCWLPKV